MQGGYGQQGYGYGQQGYGYDQQAAFQQQQQWFAQQQMGQMGGYPQQQMGYPGQQFGQQQFQQYGGYQQQLQQQQQPQQRDFPQGQKGGGRGAPGQKGGGGAGRGFGAADIRAQMESDRPGGARDPPGGGKGGAGRGQQGGQAGPKGGAPAPAKAAPAKPQMSEQELAAKKAKQKEQMEKERAHAEAKKRERMGLPPIESEAPKAEEQAAEPPPPEEPKAKEPEAKAPEPAAKAEPEEDWEAEAAEPAPAAAPAQVAEEPKPEPPKEAPKEEEPAAEEDEEVVDKAQAADDGQKKPLATPDSRPHLNVVFIGHVDAGKSTTCGNILYLSGCVDERTIEKYQKEAKDKNRDSWFLAYIMDTNEEEKAKGKTVEVGRAQFQTSRRRFTILDAPGHKSYVPNMISGASQADIGVLIISARKGEFETGFEKGGQTKEHATLAKTLGVDKLIITVNKMDEPSVGWEESRYDEIKKKIGPFLKQSGYKDEQVLWLPISGLSGDNVKERKNTPAWYQGPTLMEMFDSLETPKREPEQPVRIPMLDGYRDMGAVTAIGKVEQGTVRPGTKCVVQPTGTKCTIQSVFINNTDGDPEEMAYAPCGENVTMKVTGCSEDQLSKGYVLCPISEPARVVTKFKAQLQVIELPEERPVLTSGYKAVLHVHVACEECEILKLYDCISMADLRAKAKKPEKNPRFARESSLVTCSIQLARPTTVDTFKGVAQMGRFTLRDEGRTIAIGKITELPTKEGK